MVVVPPDLSKLVGLSMDNIVSMSLILDHTYAAYMNMLGFPRLPGLRPMGSSGGFMCNS